MNQLGVDASNNCIPPAHPLCGLFVPLPSTTRGEPTLLDGTGGKLNAGRPLLVYGSGRLVIVRELAKAVSSNDGDANAVDANDGSSSIQCKNGGTIEGTHDTSTKNKLIQGFVYRGHGSTVTVAKFSPSGAYVASGDTRGCVRIWSYDNEEHLCKLDVKGILSAPIRDIAWDADGKRVCIVGESGGESAGSSAKIVQWDTAVSCGELGQHARGRVMSCDLNHRRPFRCMTGGEDTHTLFSGNTPFVRLIVPTEKNVSTSKGHVREVNCVRFSPDGVWVCSVGGDKVMRLYHGKDGHCVYERRPAADDSGDDNATTHDGAIYACAWSSDSKFILTSSSDGTAKLWSVSGDPDDVASVSMEYAHTWNVAQNELAACSLPTPTLQPVSTSPDSCAVSPSGKAVVQIPKGGMQCGCAFVKENQPVLVGINGHLTLLPKPECLGAPSPISAMTLSGHQGVLSIMVVRGSHAYTADIDGVIVQWDLNTGACRRVVPNKNENQVEDCEDAQSTSPSHLLYQVHHGAITSLVAMASDGGQQDTIMSVGWDDMVRCSSTVRSADGTMQLQLTSQQKLNAQPNAMAAGKSLVVIVTVNGLVYKHIGSAGTSSCPPSPRRGSEATSPASSSSTTYIDIDLPYTAQCVAVAADDSLVVVGSDEGDLYFYKPNCRKTQKTKTWTQVHVVQSAHFKGVTALSFNEDSSTLASADVRDVCVWNVSDAHDAASSDDKEQHNNNVIPLISKNRWCFHTQRITSLAWMPGDQKILASSGQDDQIYLWSLQKKMKRINYNYVHRGGVVGLSFTHGGKVLVSAGKDGCICQWNVTDDVKAKFGVTL